MISSPNRTAVQSSVIAAKLKDDDVAGPYHVIVLSLNGMQRDRNGWGDAVEKVLTVDFGDPDGELKTTANASICGCGTTLTIRAAL